MRPGKAPTISDVAREAGVSPYTVSGVLNGARTNTRVSPATRERILASAARLSYQPNAQARNLARQCTNTLGILFDFVQSVEVLTTNYSSAILQGIVTEAATRRYDVLLYTEVKGSGGMSTARFRDRRTDGIIVVAPLTDDGVMVELATVRMPMIAISAAPWQLAVGQIPSIDVDNVRGIELAVEHLCALGHRRIAHLTGNANMYSVGVRREAFCAAMERQGLPVDPAQIVTCAYDGTLVPEAMEALFAQPGPPTAIVAGNDNIALAVLEVARRMDIPVPTRLSVVGFDDITATSHVTPKLTTIRQPLTEIGATAARLLIERIQAVEVSESAENQDEDAASIPPCLLSPELVVRESTAAVPVTVS